MYCEDEYDLAGFCVGIVDKRRMLNPGTIRKGDVIIGIESNGLHSNGFSLVRKVLGEKGIRRYAEELLKPTRIYVRAVLKLLEAADSCHSAIRALAHITGGAFYKKATKILPPGYGMRIAKGSWRVPRIFDIIQKMGNIEEREMYTVFNMGIGLVMVVERSFTKKIMAQLAIDKCKAWAIGKIVRSKKALELV
jgi:phosphoribosylformylglycinamidine cyclo-ligase